MCACICLWCWEIERSSYILFKLFIHICFLDNKVCYQLCCQVYWQHLTTCVRLHLSFVLCVCVCVCVCVRVCVYSCVRSTCNSFCGGMFLDIKRKLPWLLSDFYEGFHLQSISAVLFIYLGCITNAITFGGLLGDATDNYQVTRRSGGRVTWNSGKQEVRWTGKQEVRWTGELVVRGSGEQVVRRTGE